MINLNKKKDLRRRIWDRENVFPNLIFTKHQQINSIFEFDKKILPKLRLVIKEKKFKKNEILTCFSYRHSFEYAFNCKINLAESEGIYDGSDFFKRKTKEELKNNINK